MSLDIKSFSERIGVSTATVSRAFSGKGRISKKTQAHILAEAKLHGFSPNIHAQRLNRKKSEVIGLYYSFGEEPIFDYYNMELAQEIAKAAEQRGYSLHLELGGKEPEQIESRLSELSSGYALDGVIIVSDGRASSQRLLQSIKRCPVAVITGAAWQTEKSEIAVELDIESGMRAAIKELVQLGHQRIGFICGAARTGKLTSFRNALSSYGISLAPELVIEKAKSFADGQQGLKTLLPQAPSAIFCATDILAMGALNGAQAMGYNVPNDLSIVGMDDLAFTAFTTPGLSTIGIPRAQVAKTTVDLLLGQIERESESTTPNVGSRHSIQSYFVARGSIANAHTRNQDNN
jgi:DNA-binding LacI/PurR family transcriptional regulator